MEGVGSRLDNCGNAGQESLATISDLPPELLELIFINLNKDNRQSTSLVSKLWKEKTFLADKNQKNAYFVSLIQFLISKINTEKYPKEISALSNLIKESPVLNSVSFLEIKNNVYQIMELISEQLKNLDSEDLGLLNSGLKEYKTFDFLKKLIKLQEIYRKVDHFKNSTKINQRFKDDRLMNCCEELLSENHITKALEVASIISIPYNAGLAYVRIAEKLAEVGDMDQARDCIKKAMEFACIDLNQCLISIYIQQFFREVYDKQKRETIANAIIESANAIIEPTIKSLVLGEIAVGLYTFAKEKAVEAANLIPDPDHKAEILKKL